jgi:hypothetical protein
LEFQLELALSTSFARSQFQLELAGTRLELTWKSRYVEGDPMSVNQSLGDVLAAITVERKAVRARRERLVSDAGQAARVIREAYHFADATTPGAGQTVRDATLKDTQAIDTALQTIDLHLSNIAAKVRMAATAVAEAEARRKHTAAAYRV